MSIRTKIIQTMFALGIVVGLTGCVSSPTQVDEVRAGSGGMESAASPASTEEKISRFAEYSGYSPKLYDEWVSTSQYITTRDGTRLAVDISRPAVNGVAVDTPYPVIWTYSRYHRRADGVRWIDMGVEYDTSFLPYLVKHGYVAAVVNVRGGGASFGRYEGLFSVKETQDAYDVIDWFSKQPWSNGNVGMYGLSYMGITQYMAASTGHPALKAIVPENGYYDFYDAAKTGGINRSDMIETWGNATHDLDLVVKPSPVDDDPDGVLAAQAVAEHQGNFDPITPLGQSPYRDSTYKSFDWYKDMPSAVMDKINAAHPAIYHWGGWFDPYTPATLTFYKNFKGPQKLAIGPWPHVTANAEEAKDRLRVLGTESLRWYDYWLKGIDNHVMDGPPVHLSIIDQPQTSWTWKAFDDFPWDAPRSRYYLTTDSTADPKLPRDEQLSLTKPEAAGRIDYPVDLETTTGTATRWDSNAGGKVDYPEMTANGRRSITFTTAPLEQDMTVIGAPIIKLIASSSAPDMDIHVQLEEVDADGNSRYVTEGMLRASLRKLGQAPWDNFGLPWHPSRKEDEQMLTPGEPVELEFFLYPTAILINKGHRLRIVVMGADKDNTEPPRFPDAIIGLRTGGETPSYIDIPIQK
ncbi:CocE/NonD family hydrolase [Altererythrobacter sp.]|uniref:CocE/NonD family hydrolase n=1 Tax=Altererythrobacter sp. TaxID=1872480 RepID=UPI003D09011D